MAAEFSFGDLAIDRASPVPAYYQLQEYLTERIESGELAAGTALPAEREFAEQLGLSRMTVRQALERLRLEGRIVRQRGAGTFVGTTRLGITSRLTSVSAVVAAQGRTSHAHVIDIASARSTAAVADAFGLRRGAEAIRLRRLRRVDGVPFSFETAWLDRQRCAALLDTDLEGRSLLEALATLCDVQLASATEQVAATTLDSYEAAHLDSSSGAAAFRVTRTSWDFEGRPAEWVTTVIRGDRFVFTADLRADTTEPHRPLLNEAHR